jgi:hypothetical protein
MSKYIGMKNMAKRKEEEMYVGGWIYKPPISACCAFVRSMGQIEEIYSIVFEVWNQTLF